MMIPMGELMQRTNVMLRWHQWLLFYVDKPSFELDYRKIAENIATWNGVNGVLATC
jgi:hypothetical protein